MYRCSVLDFGKIYGIRLDITFNIHLAPAGYPVVGYKPNIWEIIIKVLMLDEQLKRLNFPSLGNLVGILKYKIRNSVIS